MPIYGKRGSKGNLANKGRKINAVRDDYRSLSMKQRIAKVAAHCLNGRVRQRRGDHSVAAAVHSVELSEYTQGKIAICILLKNERVLSCR